MHLYDINIAKRDHWSLCIAKLIKYDYSYLAFEDISVLLRLTIEIA